MNKLSICIGTCFIVLALTSCGGVKKIYSTEPLQASSVSFNVAGMGCPKCANNITMLLDRVVGVEDVKVDMGTGVVDVNLTGESHPNELDLATAVEEAGFTYKGMNE